MWVLALLGVFLAIAKACIFCRLPAHALPSRLAQLSSQMETPWKEWASPDFSAFALGNIRHKLALRQPPVYPKGVSRELLAVSFNQCRSP